MGLPDIMGPMTFPVRKESQTILVRFPDLSMADANSAIQQLREFIQAHTGLVEGTPPQITPQKEKSDSQDLGTILSIVFESAFALAIAGGIAAYIRAVASRVEITTPNGKILVRGVPNIEPAKIVAALQNSQRLSPPEPAQSQPKALPAKSADKRPKRTLAAGGAYPRKSDGDANKADPTGSAAKPKLPPPPKASRKLPE